MHKLYLGLFLALILNGCSLATPTPTTIKPEQIYKGYPCFDQCQNFQAGYDAAQKQLALDLKSCDTFPSPQKLGCQAYVNDLTIDTKDNGGLKLTLPTPSN